MNIKFLLTENLNDYLEEFPLANDIVSELKVRKDIPNLSSIGASLNDGYKILKNIREVNLEKHFKEYIEDFQNYKPSNRIIELSRQIDESKEINPLIVVVDEEGPYILEGSHRFDALILLGVKSFPALVVIDKEEQ